MGYTFLESVDWTELELQARRRFAPRVVRMARQIRLPNFPTSSNYPETPFRLFEFDGPGWDPAFVEISVSKVGRT